MLFLQQFAGKTVDDCGKHLLIRMGSSASTLHTENWGNPLLKGLVEEVDQMHERIAEFERLILIENRYVGRRG